MSESPQDFGSMKARLDEIVEEVSAEGISLDEALALYEEAVTLGLAACDVSEADILVPEEAPEAEGVEGEQPADGEPAAEGAQPAEGTAVEGATEGGEAASQDAEEQRETADGQQEPEGDMPRGGIGTPDPEPTDA